MNLLADEAVNSWWVEIAREFGFPTIIIIALMYAVWHGGKWLGHRLFDEGKGLITQVINKHIEFVDETIKTQQELAKSVVLIGEAAEVTKDQLTVIGTTRDNLVRAAEHSISFMEHVAEKLDIDSKTKELTDAMRRELQSTT